MLFNSLQFAIFFPTVWLIYWLLPVYWRVHFLLVSSYVFYATWSIPYALMLFGLAVVNYFFGLLVGRAQSRRKTVLWVCIAADLGVLAFFKYFNFLLRSAASVAHLLGFSESPGLLDVVLPLGISFFTFEFVHYLVDIYRGDMPEHNFSKFHVFAAFFPTQISGPIKRFQQFIPALSNLGKMDPQLSREGVKLVATGLFKKIFLADMLAPVANAGFAAGSLHTIGTIEAWASVLAFSLQIFFDFSGYTDIARGCAQLLGFHIPLNFDAPYLAISPSDFWHRWHISLSTWLRDYVYIPLGGSRRGLKVTLWALLLTFALGGLWHGAAWHFVVWGISWGVVMSAQRLARTWLPAPRIPTLLAWMSTQIIVLVTWVFFRAGDLGAASRMLASMFSLHGPAPALTNTVQVNLVILAVVALAVSFAGRRHWVPELPRVLKPVVLGGATAMLLAFVLTEVAPIGTRFIYFQF